MSPDTHAAIADMVKALRDLINAYGDGTWGSMCAMERALPVAAAALARAKLLDLDRAEPLWYSPVYQTFLRDPTGADDLLVEYIGIPLRPTPGDDGKPTVLRPSTIDELDAILNSESDEEIEILPDGSIRPKPTPGAANV